LKFHVTNSLNPQMPFGDGSEKLFGIENFGYICYVSSIFQCLYHTPQFRKAILEYPPRVSPIERRRKFTVPGKEVGKVPHALTPQPNSMNQQNYTNRAGSSSPVIPATPNSQGSSANLSSTSNFTVSDTHKDTQLEKALTEKYPALKDIETNYFLNSQKNLTLVGVIDEPSASLEWRKKASLIRGPIINLDEPFLKEYGMKEENMFTVIKDAFECITENASKTGVLSPYNLIDVIKRENILFRNAQHQDAHEFLNFLINNVLESMKQYNKESIITDIFEGELTSETKCLTCDNSSYRNEKFLDLSIDLEPDSSITNCLKMFSKIEMLNENNKFYCENCYSYQEAAKSIKLRKIPKILAFHLKRFKYSEKLDRLVKLFYRVEYVKTLRICNTTKDSEQPDKLYELYGVVVHIGGGPYHGHYVSLVKTELYGWLLFDDETIEKIDEDYVFKFFGDGCGLATAYLLFYREVDDEKKFFEDQLYNGLDSECDDADHNSAHTADRGYSLSERNNDSSNSNSDEHKGMDSPTDDANAQLAGLHEHWRSRTFHWLISLFFLVVFPSISAAFAVANRHTTSLLTQIICAIYAAIEAVILRFPDPSGHENSVSRGTAWFLAFFYCLTIFNGSVAYGSLEFERTLQESKLRFLLLPFSILTYKLIFILYGFILSMVLVVPWLRVNKGPYSQELYDSTVIAIWGVINTFTEHRPWEPWSHGDYQHTSMGIIFWCAGLLGMFLSLGRRRNFVPALTLIFTGYAMAEHVQHMIISTKVHGFFGYVLMLGGLARIMEISFLLDDDDAAKDGKIRSFQYLSPFALVLSGILFMSANEEQLVLVVNMGADHSSYIL
ncbi:hypothetical protein PICMEDRAFT_25425, partial [Pichia membranifaciens NRRL Y-2026]